MKVVWMGGWLGNYCSIKKLRCGLSFLWSLGPSDRFRKNPEPLDLETAFLTSKNFPWTSLGRGWSGHELSVTMSQRSNEGFFPLLVGHASCPPSTPLLTHVV